MSNKYVIIGSPSKQLYDKCINGNTLNGNLDSNLDYSAYWNRPEYKDAHRSSKVNADTGTPSFDYGEVINGEHLENNNTDISYITISKTPLGQVQFAKVTYFYRNKDTLVSIAGGIGANYGMYSSQSFNKNKYYILTNIIETGTGRHSHSLNMRQSISYRPLFKVA
jgi:hypothetical protein